MGSNLIKNKFLESALVSSCAPTPKVSSMVLVELVFLTPSTLMLPVSVLAKYSVIL